MKRFKVAGINFDHFHMGDNLRMAAAHPLVDIVALCDERPERTTEMSRELGLPSSQVFTDYRKCLEQTTPDVVILSPSTAEHGLWTRRVAEYGVHVIVEKPFAASLAEADSMIEAMDRGGGRLAINWPMAWYPCHRTTARLIDEGLIGDVCEVHYYDGNRGPLWHTVGKTERTADEVAREKPQSWFYSKERGGGALLDYMGYGTTLATWMNGGQVPIEVTAMADQPAGLEVDEHAIAVVRYERGLSKFETRWGTFTDPWTLQPQPKCGFVVVGSLGTISSYDYEPVIRIQTMSQPEATEMAVDSVLPPHQNPVQTMIDALQRDAPITGPLAPQVSRMGQLIVDGAVRSIAERRTVTIAEIDPRQTI